MRFPLNCKALIPFVLPLAALACSSNGGGTTGGTAGTGGTTSTGGSTTSTGGGTGGSTTGTGATTGTGGSPMECKGPGFSGMEKDVDVGIVQATVVDQDGKPAGQVIAQVCGTDICITGKTNDAGVATITVNKKLKSPAFKPGDGLVYSKFASPVPAGDSTIDKTTALKLPAVGMGDLFMPGASAKSNGIVIDVPAGGTVTVDELVYDDATKQTFRALLLPKGAPAPAVDPSLNLEIVVGAAPIETVFCPAAKLHVPNSPKWAAGAAVEFYVHGLDVSQEWAPYGGWAKVSDGAVSADGSEVVTADGGGLPVLSTFGVALKK